MYRIGLSTCGKVLDENLFAEYAKNNIKAMEISLRIDDIVNTNYKKLKEYSQKYDIELWSYHLPFSKGEPSSQDAVTRKQAITLFSEIIKKASDIGINKFVVHPSTEPIEESIRKDRMEFSKESLNTLAEIAAKNGSIIAVENLPRTCLGNCSREIKELLSANDKLRVCFDTNHLLFEDIGYFIKSIGDKIITLHVSDYDFIDERHWVPGEGDVDWNKVVDALSEINYSGVWMYELRFECPETILRSRSLTCEDLAKNANEIFNRKKPTVLGMRKEEKQ